MTAFMLFDFSRIDLLFQKNTLTVLRVWEIQLFNVSVYCYNHDIALSDQGVVMCRTSYRPQERSGRVS